ncbi:hypothetical protein [Shimia sp. MMG029]|uniref:hypothetical protein n=1 Tax=Shimia sp. MMG029 TaxID=3021978 RepID=UPI0022FDD2E9|nr:hypothetical protein [Shimia sp. MMG029]MDA5555792.1 hypothetical protein [Shimia sp. MMG029]
MGALGVVLFIAFILGTIFLLTSQAKKARETYGFGLVVNWTFVLVAISLGTMLFAALFGDETAQSYDPANALTLWITTVALAGGAGYINVRRSTVKFGIWITFLQYIAAIGIIVPLFLIFSHFRTKGVMSEMTR